MVRVLVRVRARARARANPNPNPNEDEADHVARRGRVRERAAVEARAGAALYRVDTVVRDGSRRGSAEEPRRPEQLAEGALAAAHV